MVYKKTLGSAAADVVIHIVLTAFALLSVYPFWYMLIYTISDPAQVATGLFLWPKGLSIENIMVVLKLKGIGTALLNSVLRTVLGTALTIISCTFLGYVFTKQEMPFRKALYRMLVVTMYVSGGLIPTYLVFRQYGLTNNFLVYILPSAVSAYNVILVKTFIEQLPPSLEEAAMIDGAGYFKVFVRVIFPLSMPIIATIAIFAAVGQWNSWFDNHIYNTTNAALTTLQYQLYKFLNESAKMAELLRESGMSETGRALVNALTPKTVRITTTVMAIIPIFMVYPFMQRYFIKGIMIGAVKG